MKIKIISLFENVDVAEIAANRLKSSEIPIMGIYTLRNSFDPNNQNERLNVGARSISDIKNDKYGAVPTFSGINGAISSFGNFRRARYEDVYDEVAYNEVLGRDETVLEVLCEHENTAAIQKILRNSGGYNIISSVF